MFKFNALMDPTVVSTEGRLEEDSGIGSIETTM